ncbi:MAG: glycosyltransferase family 2 protein [Proteobacteria bacterium]|nr:glycosyltransferase family 2 protein [Pseudomonadota bacterium]
MLVKDLIAESEWFPSEAYGKSKPAISVLFPSFVRNDKDLFKKVLESIVNQTFKSWELIIVDDASTSGNFEFIQSYMKKDNRISCIRHPKNVGLPAISEYEAYMKSSADYFMFAFDDFVFELDAFEKLYQAITEQKQDFCFGYVQMAVSFTKSGKPDFVHLGNFIDKRLGLDASNYIANSSIILKREVLENVGLYDPHIFLVRECDWDLWQRISKRYFLKQENILVGSEYGITRKDSLGNSYNNNMSFSNIYKLSSRDDKLKPSAFPEFNIFECNEAWSLRMQTYIHDLCFFYDKKSWFAKSKLAKRKEDKRFKKIAYYSFEKTNYHLCFEGITKESDEFGVGILLPTSHIVDNYFALLNMDAVIFNRHLQPHLNTIDYLSQMGIESYYFIDDNFLVLEKENSDPWYTKNNLKEALKSFKAVLVSTETLKEYFIKEKIHQNVIYFPPVINKSLASLNTKEIAKKEEVTIAILGGAFRQGGFFECIYPALNRLAQSKKIKLLVRKGFCQTPVDCLFEIEEFSFEENYNQFINGLKQKNIDIIIHPYAYTANASYKTNSILLSAYYLDANIIVFDEPAFKKLDEKQGILKAKNEIESVIKCIESLFSSNLSLNLKENLNVFCNENFSAKNNINVLRDLTAEIPELDSVLYEKRLKLFCQYTNKQMESKVYKTKFAANLKYKVGLVKEYYQRNGLTSTVNKIKKALIKKII